MHFPWFLLSLVLTLARSFSVSRHHPRTLLDWETENPTCEQLQDFWTAVRRTAIKARPETNEIPLMPAYEQILTRPTVVGQSGKTYGKNMMEMYGNGLGLSKGSSVIRAPVLPESSFLVLPKTEEPESEGIFGDFHDLSSSDSSNYRFAELGNTGSVPMGDKKNVENEYLYVPSWGSSKEVGTFGSFVDIRQLPQHIPIARTPKEFKADWSHLPTRDTNTLDTCDVLLGSTCTENAHCLCRGWKKLKCLDGKCLNYIQNQSNDIEGKYGSWHNGPVAQTQLRFLSIPRKNRRSIFM